MANEEYMKLITSEYANKPLFNSYVEAFLNMISPSEECLDDFNNLFDIDQAVGDQLDKIGEEVGALRKLPVVVEEIPAILTDDLYRKLIKARIYSNQWNGTIEDIQVIFEKIYPNVSYEILDNQDMTYTVNIILPDVSEADLALITNGFILPKPSGVEVIYNITDTQLFGWDLESDFVNGWDIGIWKSE